MAAEPVEADREAVDVTPLDAAFHDWADANEGASTAYDGFAGGWAARQPEVELLQESIEKLRGFWQLRVASIERERDEAMQRLSSALYERDAFRRQRDAVAGMIERSRTTEPPAASQHPSVSREATS